VDSCIDSPGILIIKGGKICGIYLGECKSTKKALLYSSAFLAECPEDTNPDFYDAKGLTLMPGFIDMHVHFRYPGQTQKEDLDSGLHAAVAGGYTTVVLMPNTTPVISDRELAQKVMDEANGKNLARVFQTVSITKNFEGNDTSGIDSIKADEFPVITEDGHDVLSAAVMLDAMKKAGEKGIIVSCHCEDPSLAQAARPYRQRALSFMKQYGIPAGKIHIKTPDVPAAVNFEIDGNLTRANSLLALAEDTATIRNIEIAKTAGCHVHICHCSTKASMDAVRRAKEEISQGSAPEGFACTVEVTPHHLSLVGTDAPNIRALVNPPLRSEDDRRAIIEALRDGTVDTIATDHAPHTQDDKAAGSPGFSGIETAFAVCNTVLVKKEGFSLSKLSKLMSENPAKLLRLKAGRIAVDYRADLVLLSPDEEWIVNSENFASKGKSTPLEGKKLAGKIHATFFGGKQVF
ncbi:MAG: amidohydrolase family protein, partial [Treponema sp.]|nr:amidohydrolase family protein [Treponema sp.]